MSTLKLMPSAKDGLLSPFPVVTPGFIQSLGKRRADSRARVKLATLAEHLAAMIESLDEVERGVPESEKPKVGDLLDSLNGAYQKASRLSREMAQEAAQG